tara:strand:+ start:12927 stop:13682 length:756 start_codon:yes stop_codon:yes gene_type:complete
MGITYNRTMKITYALANSIGDKQVIGAFLSNLHDKGVSAMNYSWENEPSDKLGKHTRIEEQTTTQIVAPTFTLNCPDSMLDGEISNLIKQLVAYEIDASKVDEISTTELNDYGIPESSKMFISQPSGEGNSTLKYTVKNDDAEIQLVTYISQNDYSNQTMTIKFVITWCPSRVQKKGDIELAMVDKPIKDMGRIQGIVERQLSLLEWDGEAPEIDCHFDAMTETRSECAPDIVKRVREARNSPDESTSEEE